MSTGTMTGTMAGTMAGTTTGPMRLVSAAVVAEAMKRLENRGIVTVVDHHNHGARILKILCGVIPCKMRCYVSTKAPQRSWAVYARTFVEFVEPTKKVTHEVEAAFLRLCCNPTRQPSLRRQPSHGRPLRQGWSPWSVQPRPGLSTLGGRSMWHTRTDMRASFSTQNQCTPRLAARLTCTGTGSRAHSTYGA
jgi:hypothetical protein